MINVIKILFIFFFSSIVFCQFDKDPRQLALGGAYSTIAEGYYASGINPALLGTNKGFDMNLFSVNSLNINNSFLSIAYYNSINGANFEDPFAKKFYDKNDLLSDLDQRGISFDFSLIADLPILNFSINKFSFTTNFNYFTELQLPDSFAALMLEGNVIGDTIDVNLGFDTISTSEVAVSYGHSFGDFSIGFGLKYIQGLLYAGMEEVRDSYFITTETELYGTGSFLVKQSIGGSGLAVDFGFATNRFENGWMFGASAINMFGKIKYDNDAFFNKSIDEKVRPILESNLNAEYYLRNNEMLFFDFRLDSLNAQKLAPDASESTPTLSDIFSFSKYKVVLIDGVDSFSEQCSDSECVLISDSTYLYPTNNNENLDLYNISEFEIDYPASVSIGGSHRDRKGNIFSCELGIGFSDSFGNSKSPRLGIGYELNQFKIITLRSGIVLGGKYKSSFSCGLGLNIKPIRFNISLSTKNALSIMNTRGLELGFSTIFFL